jgi:creatinine amidohydrolase/Fe(II)-dependent formamide hydrolase-like protein
VNDHAVDRDKVMLGECTRREIREALQSGRLKGVIIPIGAIEQHNEHLSLNLDIVLSTFISQEAALQLYPQVTVAPSCPVGYSPYHMARKGTLTLRKETLLAYLYDVIESLKTHGINAILVVNGHGGNHGLLGEKLPAWRRELGVVLDEVSYWTGVTDQERRGILQGYRDLEDGKLDTVARQTALNHASEEETSVMMAASPKRVRAFTMADYDRTELDYARHLSAAVRAYLEPFSKEGWPEGGPNPENPRDRARQENATLATADKGEALIAIHTRFVAGKMQDMIDTLDRQPGSAGNPAPAESGGR